MQAGITILSGLVGFHSHLREAADSDEPLIAFAEDCRAAGVELEAATAE